MKKKLNKQKQRQNQKRKAEAIAEIEGNNEIFPESKSSEKSSKRARTSEDDSNKEKKPLLSGDEYLALRNRLKERKKLLKQRPKFELKLLGQDACVDKVTPNLRTPLFLTDLRDFLIYSIIGDKGPCGPTMR